MSTNPFLSGADGLGAVAVEQSQWFEAGRGDPIVIGLEAPLRGDQRGNGRDMWRGAKLAVEELNREGGILGRRVELVRADDRADPKRALSVAKKLNRIDVDAVIGPYNSGVGLINLPYYLEKEILTVHLTSTDDTSGEGVTVQPKNSQIAPVEEAYILSQGIQRVSMLVDPSAYTVGMADRLEASLMAKGVQVERFAIAPGSADYSAVIEQALAVDPGLVYVSTYYPEGSSIARGLEASNTAAQRFFGLANVDPAFVAEAGLKAARSSVFSGVPEAEQLPHADAYVQAYEERFDRTPGVWGTFTYDSMKVLADAMETAGTAAFKPALDSLLQTRNYKGATGKIGIDPLTGNRVKVPVFILNVDADGVFVPSSAQEEGPQTRERLSLSLDPSTGSLNSAALGSGTKPARFLKGTWVGTGSGYRSEGYKSEGDYKFVISKARGFAAQGTKQFRDEDSGKWSEPEACYFTLLTEDGDGQWQISGAEGDGIYQGTTTEGGGLILNYLEAGGGADDAALRLTLSKRR